MRTQILCSAYKDGKVYDLKIYHSVQEMNIYKAECAQQGAGMEAFTISAPEHKEQKREVAYVPPPKWGGRVVCVETGWIFKTISAAAKFVNGSQWALRKAVIRNTVFHGYHWRMFCDTPTTKPDKFT